MAFSSPATNLVENDTNGRTDVFVHERQTATQPDDCIAPTTTATAITTSGGPYETGAWTNEDVKVTFSAQDEGGSGTKDIRYSASGDQSIPETVYDEQDPPVINTEGTTSISYFATDNAGNEESPAKTFEVKIDRTPPSVSSTSPPNNATGVAATAAISAIFSESGSGIDPDSLTSETLPTDTFKVVQVKPTGNVTVPGTVGYEEGLQTATFTPSSSLAKGAYRATLTTDIADEAGNVMPDYTWQFATAGPPKR